MPWVVTFESTIPRTNQTVNRPWERDGNLYNLDRFTSKSLELLADDSCKKCIAISKSAFNIQMNMLEHFDISSEVKENLIRKTVVVHPPQEIFCSEEEIKQKYQNINCCIEILFVGRLFFRKGGEMIVKALEKYAFGEINFHLTIVSNFENDNGLYIEDNMCREEWIEKLENTPWITYIKSLPNKKVLELCKKAHIGCLPTLQDTYGYSTLEMQACGCPVVTTNIRACSEINSDDCGWFVPVKIDNIGGEAILYDKKEKEERKKEIIKGLENVFAEIFKNPSAIEEKAIKARKRIELEHSLDDYAKEMNQIYQEAIGD